MKIYLPVVKKNSFIGQEDENENILYFLIMNSPHQQRVGERRHPLLDIAAQKKADDMANRNYYGHRSPDGVYANDVIRSVGYKLPDHYLPGKNYCESLSVGGGRPQAVADAWFNSVDHRQQVYGHDKFFREQLCIGIGRAKAKDNRILSVFFSAPCI